MKFEGKLTVEEQLGPYLDDTQSNTLAVTTHGGEMVYLDVSGALDVGDAEADSHIVTVMTVGECTALIRLLQAGCLAAASAVAGAGVGAKAPPTDLATPGVYPWEVGHEL